MASVFSIVSISDLIFSIFSVSDSSMGIFKMAFRSCTLKWELRSFETSFK